MTVVKVQKHSIGNKKRKLKQFLEANGYTVTLQPDLNERKQKIVLVIKKGDVKIAEAITAREIHVFREANLMELQVVLSSFKVKSGEINLHQFQLKE